MSYPSLETYGFWRRQAKPNGTIVVKYLNANFWTIFCNRRKWYLLQVDSICILDSNDALIGCDFTQIAGCYWELLLERGREILWKRKRMFYRAVAWPSKNAHVSAAIWFHAAHAIHGSQPGGLKQKEMKFKPRIKLNHNIYIKTLWTSFAPRKTSLVVRTFMCHQVDSSLGFTKEFEKNWIRANLNQTLTFYETNLLKKHTHSSTFR